MSVHLQHSTSPNRREPSQEIRSGEARFSAEQKGKHRETYPTPQATCLNRAPMSSARSTLFMDEEEGHNNEGRLDMAGVALQDDRDPRSTVNHYDRHGSDAALYVPPASRSHSHVPALEDGPMSTKLRLTTPAFVGIGRSAPPHWSVAIYERQLFPKALGYPLPVPTGLKIGDVCFVAASGKIQRCFNITVPTELPHYFSVLHPPLSALDVCKYQDFPGSSYIASRTLTPIRADPASLTFRCPTSAEASILVFPQGAVSTELSDVSRFREFISQNAPNWKRFVEDVEKDVGDQVTLRLITSTVTAPFWANAVVCTGDGPSVLKFAETKTVDGRSAYFWDTRGFADAAVSASDAWNPNSRNDTTVAKGFSICPRRDVTMSEPAAGTEELARRIRPAHPGDVINKRLLTMKPDVKLVVCHDRDWCAIYKETDMAVLPESELLERVFDNHEVQEDNDLAYLEWKPRKQKRPSSTALTKQIEELRESLEKVAKDDITARTKLLHSTTSSILQFLRVAASRNVAHAEMLMSVALMNAQEEVSLLTQREELTVEAVHLLAQALWTAFEMAQDPKVLDQAISTYRKALAVNPSHMDSLSDLAIALWARYNRYKQQKDLEELIELYKALLFGRPVNNKDEVSWLNSLGMGLWEKYRRIHDPTDMDHAVAYLRRASRAYPIPCDPFTLSNLGNALLARSRHRRDLSDLNEALVHYRKALADVNALHPGRSAFLSNLADALIDRYERTQDIGDLNEAIRAYERVLELPPPHHRDKATCVMFYANALHDRFRKMYDGDDLKLAIKKYREAKQRASPAHQNYGKIIEKLILAEKELGRLSALQSTTHLTNHSIPMHPYPRPISQKDFIQQHPGPAPHVPTPTSTTNGNTNGSQKFRIVRPPSKKPYTRPEKGVSSGSESTPPPSDGPHSSPVSPRHALPPRARRHHTLAHA